MIARLDPELAAGLQAFAASVGGDGLDFNDIAAVRASSMQMLEALKAQLPKVPGVISEDVEIPGLAQAPAVTLRIYRPQSNGESPHELPVLLWIHGGGYIIGSIEQDDIMARQIAVTVQCAVVSVEYRLAPENPFPAPLDDCYAALQWIYENARELHFDRTRIAVGGASAGGGLAAGLALLARDRGEVPVCFQLLIYPMIDDSNIEQASAEIPDTLLWTRSNNLMGWRSYLGQQPGGAGVSAHAAPFREKNLCKLPPAYIAVGELDLFLLEDIEYAKRLTLAGVATELHVYPGAFHGFDAMAGEAAVSKRFKLERDHAIKRAFFR